MSQTTSSTRTRNQTKFMRMDSRQRRSLLNALNSTVVSILIQTEDGRRRRLTVTRSTNINGRGGKVGPATASSKSISVYELNRNEYRTINTSRIISWSRLFG